MQSMGASGLALASSIGGWVQFVMTLQALGWHHLIDILKSKYSLYFLIIMPLFTLAMIGIDALVG
ncbi:MAG: lipid II flippase MurJ, partial [Campylobacterales bacterium]|nr:lipid II flippase MurJ [Campylobacterales bacterium]